jgi:hypothetical protein
VQWPPAGPASRSSPARSSRRRPAVAAARLAFRHVCITSPLQPLPASAQQSLTAMSHMSSLPRSRIRPGLRRRAQVRPLHAPPHVARTPRTVPGLFKPPPRPPTGATRAAFALVRLRHRNPNPPPLQSLAAVASLSTRSNPGAAQGGEKATSLTCSRPRAPYHP